MGGLITTIATAGSAADIAGLIVIIGLLVYVIYLQINNQRAMADVSHNHLSGLPDMDLKMDAIRDQVNKLVTLQEQELRILATMNDNLTYLRGRLNGPSHQ